VTDFVIHEETDPDQATMDAVDHGLDDFNDRVLGQYQRAPLWLVVRDDNGKVIAGLHGKTGSWCFIEWLWVAEVQRRAGLGSQLLRRAEMIARDRHCAGIYLDTFSFQAPDFYARHGFQEFGRLTGCPPGHDRIWLSKRFAA
jgi:GNAT superfamily N-acetyltransferase